MRFPYIQRRMVHCRRCDERFIWDTEIPPLLPVVWQREYIVEDWTDTEAAQDGAGPTEQHA